MGGDRRDRVGNVRVEGAVSVLLRCDACDTVRDVVVMHTGEPSAPEWLTVLVPTDVLGEPYYRHSLHACSRKCAGKIAASRNDVALTRSTDPEDAGGPISLRYCLALITHRGTRTITTVAGGLHGADPVQYSTRTGRELGRRSEGWRLVFPAPQGVAP